MYLLQSKYKHLEKNYCRNHFNGTGSQVFNAPWCFTSQGKPSVCNVWPCGKYISNITFPSGQHLGVSGTNLCVNKKTTDTNVSLVSRYDFGPVNEKCNYTETEMNLTWSEMLVQNKELSKYISSRRTIWYRYIWIVLGNIQIIAIITLIIFCKQRIVKTLEEDKKSQRMQANLKSAFSATSK